MGKKIEERRKNDRRTGSMDGIIREGVLLGLFIDMRKQDRRSPGNNGNGKN